jgi:ABC-2 type transport system ATP-binding protein
VANGTKAELLAAGGLRVRALDPATLQKALERAGLAVTAGADGALTVQAEAEAVGQVAASISAVLLELRPVDTGGLEELFLTLTAGEPKETAR